ncbi:MAG TPA: hypothetical protein VFI73_13225 [Candidatus Nitrosopolaris sp.]|nr:hypothetical protein [Candidatus Nitrosopolaris sp.]
MNENLAYRYRRKHNLRIELTEIFKKDILTNDSNEKTLEWKMKMGPLADGSLEG